MPMHELDHFNVFTDEYTPERIPHPGDTEEILGWRFGAEMAHHEVFYIVEGEVICTRWMGSRL